MGSPSVRPAVGEALSARASHGHRFTLAPIVPMRRLPRQVPGTGHAPGTVPVQALRLPLAVQAADVPADPDRSPSDVWPAVEDLWLRLAAVLSVQVDSDGPTWRLVVKGYRLAQAVQLQDLQPHALNADLFAWRLEGRGGSFVQRIDHEGDDLAFALTSLATIERWPQGDDLAWQVHSLLGRLRMQGQALLAGAAP